MIRRIASIVACGLVALGSTARAEPPTYPIVFKDTTALREAGIAFGADAGSNFESRCYSYGEGGYGLSVSDGLLVKYKAKGFSLESLCMGLVSEARFDPETGKRLPTYIYFDAAGLRKELAALADDDPPTIRRYKGRDPETLTFAELKECCEGLIGFVSEELPLSLPSCFKNGNPYSDCAWRYAIKSGEKLSDASVEKFRNLGRAIEERMADMLSRKPVCGDNERVWPCAMPKTRNEWGKLYPEGLSFLFVLNGDDTRKQFPGLQPIPEALLKGQDLSFFDISEAFPRGFGYALYAEGGAGPSASLGALRSVAGGAPKSQVTKAGLRKLIED